MSIKKLVFLYVLVCAVLAISVTVLVVGVVKSDFGQKVGKAVNAELDRKIEGNK